MSAYGVKNLTEGNILGQLLRLAAPIMATSFVQMAYSLTDMAWVGRVGSKEVAAVGSVGLLTWLISSFAVLTKVGAEIGIGQLIGAQKMDDARSFASHTTTLSLIIGIVIAFILFVGAGPILSVFHLEMQIHAIAGNFLRIIMLSSPLLFMTFTFSGIYNASGRSIIPFYLNSFGLVVNMILDPLFIFGFGWGVLGAACATCLSQTFVFGLFMWQMKQTNGILNRFPYLVRLQKPFTLRIFRLGLPVAAITFLFAGINSYLARIASLFGGHIGLMSQTTGGQIEAITWNTSQGFSTALGAFVAQNYAAGKMSRAFRAYRYTLTMMLSLGIVVTLAFVFFGKEIFGLIVPEETASLAGGDYLKIVGFSQIFMMLELTTQGIFNGTGRTLPPAIISISLNLLRIPLAFALAPHLGINGVWWAIAISTFIKGIALPIWFVLIRRRI